MSQTKNPQAKNPRTNPLASALQFSTLGAISQIGALEWDSLVAGEGKANPFIRHAFLSALEESGSASPTEGWHPVHLIARDNAGALVGGVPLYLKGHSYGEYVFDWSWANAFERAGGAYYPKLQAAIPFTPVPGSRLLTAPSKVGTHLELQKMLSQTLISLTSRLEVSSLHITFLSQDEWKLCELQGYLPRLSHQYHWFNRNYTSFEDFLSTLTSRKRKAIRNERAEARKLSGLTLRLIEGRDISENLWDDFYACYRNTSADKMGMSYLRRNFFSLLGEQMADSLVLTAAFNGNQMIAGALHFQGDDCLYGRNWGALAAYPLLHFELCYYMAQDYAIAKKLSRVEAGVQGEHKMLRGYEPVLTYSAHWIENQSLRAAIDRFLSQERPLVRSEIEDLKSLLPYRQGV